jgi:hypothetical protein
MASRTSSRRSSATRLDDAAMLAGNAKARRRAARAKARAEAAASALRTEQVDTAALLAAALDGDPDAAFTLHGFMKANRLLSNQIDRDSKKAERMAAIRLAAGSDPEADEREAADLAKAADAARRFESDIRASFRSTAFQPGAACDMTAAMKRMAALAALTGIGMSQAEQRAAFGE